MKERKLKEKNAFTLIELLAIILILGIIALIAVPTVSDIVNDSKKTSFKTNVQSILVAAEQKCELEQLDGLPYTSIYNFSSSGVTPSLQIKGEIPTNGIIEIDEECNVSVVAVSNDNYCVTKTENQLSVSSNINDCNIVQKTEESCFVFNASTKTITDYNYNGTTCTANVIIPTTINDVAVENIGAYAFRSKSLESVSIPDTILDIGKYAFALNNLSSVVIPSSLTRLRDGVFYYNQITSITIPNNITSIGYEAFENNFVSTLNIPEGLTTLGADAFEDNLLKSVNFSTTVTSIGREAFRNNLLESIDIPSSVKEIGSGAFQENFLTTLVLPNGVEKIGSWAFSYNDLTSITIPNSVIQIENSAFNENQLEDDQAFIYARNSDGSINEVNLVSYGGARRENVVIPDNVESIAGQALYSLGLKSITIPDSVVYIHGGSFNNNKLSDDQAFIYYRNGNGTIDYTKIVAYGGEKRDGIVIPSQVKTIGENAFSGNSIKSIDIPSTVTNIEARAFNVNKLSDDEAFIYARNEDGTIDNTRLVSYGGAKLKGVEIPSTVQTIGEETFRSVGLLSITVPSSVTTIETKAFLYNDGVTININRLTDKISGSPWGASGATVNWTGSN